MGKERIVTIDSILGGHSELSHFGMEGQFRSSIGIDPAQPLNDSDDIYATVGSGLLRPAACQEFSGSVINAAPLWMVTNPKDALVYVYDALGSTYTIDATFSTVTALSDGGSMSNSTGNGAEYYDNYIYFSKGTTVARYGPLNGVASFTGDYWVGVLGKTALVDTTYPTSYKNEIRYPNHPLHRHSDGRLYIGDVVGNNGTIHWTASTKTAVEGDTDNGSTYNALDLGYGLWPTDIESFGEEIAIALYEGSSAGLRQKRAKIAFWNGSSASPSKIIWDEFPDQIITAMKYVNGVLYTFSGNFNSRGFRVSRFVGGYSFSEVAYIETGEPPMPGAVDATLSRILAGNYTNVPVTDGCVYSVGLQKSSLGQGTFNIMRATGGNSSTCVTSVALADNAGMNFAVPVIGWTKGSGTSNNGLNKQGTTYNNAQSVWWSQTIRIPHPFKITKIRIPLTDAIAANMTITPKIYVDDGESSTTLTAINNSNYSGKRTIVIRPENLTGEHNFWLEFVWSGSALLGVNLPITIHYEPLEY
jgi:hypothetical protein